MWYGIGNTVIANPSTIRVGLRRTGRVFLYNGAMDIGQGSSTILPQICADALGLPVSLFDQVMGDTDLTADAGKSSASRQTFVSGNAARFAGEALRRKLLALLGASVQAQLAVEGAAAGGRVPADTTGASSSIGWPSMQTATSRWAKVTSIRPPRRWIAMARACPTPPTASRRRWRRSRSTSSWARSRS